MGWYAVITTPINTVGHMLSAEIAVKMSPERSIAAISVLVNGDETHRAAVAAGKPGRPAPPATVGVTFGTTDGTVTVTLTVLSR